MTSTCNLDIFDVLPDNARAWVYQSNRPFTDVEVVRINEQIEDFVTEWTSHSRDVIAKGVVCYDRFLIFVADESQFKVSGCSIDSSVQFVRTIGSAFGVDMFDRFEIAYKQGEEVFSTHRDGFQQLLDDGKVTEDTTVFNNMITTHAELLSQWEVPFKESWHQRVFSVV